MSDDRARSLARFVEPALEDRALDKQWLAIRDRMRARRAPWLAMLAGGTALAASLGALALVLTSGDTGHEGLGATVAAAPCRSGECAAFETGADPITVAVADGSHIEIDPHARLEAAEAPGRDVRFALRRGRARFDVERDPSRTFAITAGDVEVVVIGTAFSVEHAGDRVEVRVERGVVEVRTARATHRLGAGETWSGQASAPAEIASIDAPPADEPAERPRREGPSATELFERAREARRAGDDREAADAYAELVRRHPRDSHVGLASFELARIRMDALGDPRGAIEPLERAIAARVFREDAMARLVEAYDATRQTARCRSARERYVREHPEGVHLSAVSSRCP